MGEKKKTKRSNHVTTTTRYGSGQRRKNRYIVLPPSFFNKLSVDGHVGGNSIFTRAVKWREGGGSFFPSPESPELTLFFFSSQGFHAHIICTRTLYSLTYDTCQVPVAGRGIREVYREHQQRFIGHHSTCIADISRVLSSITVRVSQTSAEFHRASQHMER